MREGVGGTMLMYIVFFFLAIYILFMAVVINYGRVFRVKNALISYIENQEAARQADLRGLARSMGYNGTVDVCSIPGKNATYYSVKVQISFQLPLISRKVNVPISGKTSAIKNLNNGTSGVTSDVNPCA